jgi:hypothetical protein
VESEELLRQLVDLSRDAGLRVRPIAGRAGAEGEPPAASGVCRIGAENWVVLSGADSIDQRVAVLARALRELAPDFLESRYLPPALREHLGPDRDPG